jgi:hypothetical protein
MAEAKNEDHCGDCRFWLVQGEPVGVCQRFPPATISAAGHPSWVVTRHEDWCGEFQNPPPEAVGASQSGKHAEPPPEKAKAK